YSIIVTQDKERMKEMAPFHFNQPIATNAPLILTFCADFNRFNKYCEYRDADTDAYSNMQSYHWAVADTLIAAQNACVAAESLGLGICWLGTITYNADKFIGALNLPNHVVPLACISIGYPAENPELTDKLPLEALVHYERYADYAEDEINRLYAEKEADVRNVKLLEDNQLPNLAQIFTKKRYAKKDNEHFANVLVEVLKKQQFLK
ncbi:nitroreductase family protein, partial [Bacteroidales bacterium OttesenSCG-928-B11]|nr:nitroreductase family protein [Bacteroidales bacterium OttesenSCG-928-B11]